MLKTVLEKRAAPGVNTPVDFVKDEAWMDIMGEPRKVDLLLTILDSPASEERRSTPNRTPLLNPTDAPSRMTTKVQNVLKDEICPICQVEPLTADACLVTLCQHRFHVRCYAQLPIDAADCPMCRFSLYDLLNDAKCQTCRTYDDLWTCLICGFIGCGRGRKGHSHEHYEECRHSCAMQMNTNRIWNFKTRMFLHQEIAVLFGEEKDTGGTFLGNLDFDWTGLTSKQEEEAEDEQLQLALEESKEKAVLEFYANVQKDLIKEQHEWYITEMRKRIAATGPTATVVTADHDAVFDTLESVMLAEHHHRRYLAECYVAEVRDLCTRSATEAYAISKAYRLKMTELKEQNLLLTHTVEGLQGKLVRAKERLVEAKRRGEVSRQLNKDKIAALQKELEDAFA
ncbi:BRCA1-associated protein [Angomonas deanei]|nr:BRCA1-associated protein [Angomonas deanei]|eukprot:EPY20859.1 BRCA1-associated protein [Angomonas deanei]